MNLLDPLKFSREMWPQFRFYREQQEVMYSVLHTPETVVVAGNQLGKDFVAGFVIVWYFMAALMLGVRCRIVTTSVAEDHLKVLWAEVGRFVTGSKYPLVYHPEKNPKGPIVLNYQEIRRTNERHAKNPDSYAMGMVAEGGMEKLAGHHADMTLAVMDEASGLHDLAYEKTQGWASGSPGVSIPMKRYLIFGNPHETQNFFRKMVKTGNIEARAG